MRNWSLQGDIWDHEAEAWRIWLKHFEECADELGINFNADERRWAKESFEEGQQLKIYGVRFMCFSSFFICSCGYN